MLLSMPQIPGTLWRDVSDLSRFKTQIRWVSSYQLWVYNNAQICPNLPFLHWEHIDSHYAYSSLSTIELRSTQSIDKNTFSLLELYKNTQPNWFCFPNNATLSNGNGFVRCSANGDVNELRERCRNLGQLGMIWNHGTSHIIIVKIKFNLHHTISILEITAGRACSYAPVKWPKIPKTWRNIR